MVELERARSVRRETWRTTVNAQRKKTVVSDDVIIRNPVALTQGASIRATAARKMPCTAPAWTRSFWNRRVRLLSLGLRV